MATGRVLQFDAARGYGFVAADDGGEDVFLHASVFDGDPDWLAPGIRVEFKVMAGERGRKAFAAHLAPDDDQEAVDEPVAALTPAPAAAIPVPRPSVTAQTDQADQEPSSSTDDEQMCDVLSPTEFGQELTELLLSHAPTLTGQQILEVRHGVLECARKHGWVDI